MFFVYIALAAALLCISARKFLRSYAHVLRLSARVPSFPGALPVLGHIHKVCLSSNQKLFELFDEFGKRTNERGGVLKLWFGPAPFFMLTDAEDIQKAMNCSVEKNYIYSFADRWMRSSLLLATTPVWKARVKVIQPSFTPKTTLGFLGIFNDESEALVQHLTKHAGQGPFLYHNLLCQTAIKTIFQSAFGMKLEHEKYSYGQYQKVHENISKRLVTRFRNLLLHPDLLYQFSALAREEDQDMEIMHGTSKMILRKAKEMYSEKKDNPDEMRLRPFLESMLQSNSDGTLSDVEMQSDLNLIIGAGFETTAVSVSFTLALLGEHPDVQEKLYAEIKQVFGDTDRNVTKEDLSELLYLEAVIKESLRLYPTVPYISRKLDRDVQLRHYLLPSGSDIIISFWALNRNPKLWDGDAQGFRPERWLDSSVPKILTGGAAFGLGKRGCIGKVYAMMLMKTILAHILRRFKVTASSPPRKLQFDIALHSTEPLTISIDRR